jgi:hypothetical protein
MFGPEEEEMVNATRLPGVVECLPSVADQDQAQVKNTTALSFVWWIKTSAMPESVSRPSTTGRVILHI